MENNGKFGFNEPLAQEKGKTPIKDTEAFYNPAMMKLHIDGKLTLTEDRNSIASIEDESLAKFAKKYTGGPWVNCLQIISHPDFKKEWQAGMFNSVDGEYPRIFAHRQFSEETPILFEGQEQHTGIALDDLSLKDLPDTIENTFIRNKLTEGDIKTLFFLKDVPSYKVLDLRDVDLSLKNLGPTLKADTSNAGELLEILKQSQFNKESVERMKTLLQEDDVLRNQIALLIVNDNSAIVLDSDYLIDIAAKKRSLKTEDLGHAPIPEKVTEANEFFNQDLSQSTPVEYVQKLRKVYELDRINLTDRQKDELSKDLVSFINSLIAIWQDEIFDAMYTKILALEKLPAEELGEGGLQLITDAKSLHSEGENNLAETLEAYQKVKREPTDNDLAYFRKEAFKEPLNKLIDKIDSFIVSSR